MTTMDPRLLALRDRLPGVVLRGSNNVSYHLRERIGEGGQGWVFTANWDEPGGFVVIVKVLRPDAVSSDALARFRREAEVLRMLSTQGPPNPYVVRFFDHAVAQLPSPLGGEPLVLPFTVLEYVNGTTLEHLLETSSGRGLGVERVRRILRQVSQALDSVHQKKVVHRDLKPSNILLATEAGAEVAKVTDFGLVKLVEMSLQRTTALAGATLGYAPPEQYEQGNQRVSVRTDVFSLAAIAFEMLAGKPAFPFIDGENPLLIVTRILNGPRPRLSATTETLAPELRNRSDLVARLDAEFARALAADPSARHGSVNELWGAIEPLLRTVTEAPSPAAALAFLETVPAYSQPKSPTQHSGAIPAAVTPPRSAEGSSPPSSEARPSNPPLASVPRSSDVRVRQPASDSSIPAAWAWRIASRPIGPGVVRAASFAHDGHTAVGVGPGGMARWEREWIAMAVPSAVDTRVCRTLRRLRNGDVIVAGDRGTVARVAPSGVHEAWAVPDREAVFHGVHVDERMGLLTLVGERPGAKGTTSPVGTVVQLHEGRVTFAADVRGAQRLRAATRVLSGAIVACGDWGAVARVAGGVAEFVGSVCAGHLLAIEALPDGGAVTVGAGGHALHLSSRLEAKLEAVQTTRDLLSVTVAEDGAAWAGAGQARILRRAGEAWTRMSGELGLGASVIAVWAGERLVRAICDDGAVIEGQLG